MLRYLDGLAGDNAIQEEPIGAAIVIGRGDFEANLEAAWASPRQGSAVQAGRSRAWPIDAETSLQVAELAGRANEWGWG